MFTSQVVKDSNGQHYIICLRNFSTQAKAVQPKKFTSIQASFQFINSLQVTEGVWLSLASANSFYDLKGWKARHPHLPIEHYIIGALVHGSIQAYKLNYDVSSIHSGAGRRVKGNGKTYQIAPAAYLLINSQAKACTYSTLSEAESTINELVSNQEQAEYLVRNLNISTPCGQSVNSGEIQQALTQALYDGQIVVTEEQDSATSSVDVIEEVVEVVSHNDMPPAAAENEEVAEDDVVPICELVKLTVECAHDGRKQIVSNDTGFVPSLDVVASPKDKRGFDKLTATVETTSPCGNHSSNSSSIQPQPEKTTKNGLLHVYELSSEPITNPLKVLWLPSIKPQRYKISANACERFSPCAIEVNVYPKVKWNIAVGYSFGNKQLEKSEGPSGALTDKLEDKSGKFTGKAEYYYDEVKKDFATEYQYEIEKILGKFDAVSSKVDDFLEAISGGALNKSGVKLEVFWPNISIKYENELLEDKSSSSISSSYALSIAADPLIGMKGSIDVFPILLKFVKNNPGTGAIGAVLDAVVEGVGNDDSIASFKADVQLVFSVDVKLFINFSTKGTNGNDDANCKSEQGLSIEFQFEGLVGVKGHMWVIKFEKNYRAGIKTGFVGKTVIDRDDIGYFWYFRFLFNGLVIVFTKYEKLEKNISNDNRLLNRFSKVPNQTEETASKEFVWLEPSPDEEAPNDTTTASGSAQTQSVNKHYLIRF